MNNQLVIFEVGNIYRMNFIGDSQLKPQYICVKRTAKSATFESIKNPKDSITRKIQVFNNSEYIREGCYSMAPTIYADKVVG